MAKASLDQNFDVASHPVLLPLLFSLGVVFYSSHSAHSADYVNSAECLRKYMVAGYLRSEDLVLKAGSETLSDRVWQAFHDEFADRDPTKDPSKRSDLLPQNALVKPLIDPQEAAVALMMAIRRAKHDVTIGTYIFGKDPFAYAMLKEVKDALARGVNVHILIDSMGSPDLRHNELKALYAAPRGKMIDDFGNPTDKNATVEAVLFNPPTNAAKIFLKFLSHVHNLHLNLDVARRAAQLFTRRMHTKIAGVDMDYPDGIAFLGGRNKDGLYYGYEKVGPHTYNDTEIIIRNDSSDFSPGNKSISSTIGREFRKLYSHLLNKELVALMDGSADETYQKELNKMDDASRAMWADGGDYQKVLERLEREKFLDTGFDQTATKFLTEIENINRMSAYSNADQTGDKNLISITRNINRFAQLADKAITIVTPYPNITYVERQGLIQKMLSNPDMKFTMVTNSLYSGDNIITQYVVDSRLIPALKSEAKAAALKAGKSQAEADAFVKRFKIYALGRLDGVLFGGKTFYGKLHAKYALFSSKDPKYTKTVVGSYNGDNISRLHNAEIAVSTQGEGVTSEGFEKKTEALISMSYEWGSPEWLKLRNSRPLWKKRLIEKVVSLVERYLDPLE